MIVTEQISVMIQERRQFPGRQNRDTIRLARFCDVAGQDKLLKMVAITHQACLTIVPCSNYIITNPESFVSSEWQVRQREISDLSNSYISHFN